MFALNLTPEFNLTANIREPDDLHRLIKITVTCGNQRELTNFKYTPLTRRLKGKLSVWNEKQKNITITIDNGFEIKKISMKKIYRGKLWFTVNVFRIRIDKMESTLEVSNDS